MPSIWSTFPGTNPDPPPLLERESFAGRFLRTRQTWPEGSPSTVRTVALPSTFPSYLSTKGDAGDFRRPLTVPQFLMEIVLKARMLPKACLSPNL